MPSSISGTSWAYMFYMLKSLDYFLKWSYKFEIESIQVFQPDELATTKHDWRYSTSWWSSNIGWWKKTLHNDGINVSIVESEWNRLHQTIFDATHATSMLKFWTTVTALKDGTANVSFPCWHISSNLWFVC